MTVLKRIALLLILTVAVRLTSIRFIIEGEPSVILNALSRTGQLALWLLPLIFLPVLRDVGSLKLTRTWTVFLALPFTLANLFFWGGLPSGYSPLLSLCLAWTGLAIGIVEELAFRGYGFRQSPELHPRFVIFISALFFSLAHFTTREDPGAVCAAMITTFFVGIGFGIIRLVTGSLGWCILIHGATDAAFYFVAPERSEAYQRAAFPTLIICSVLGLVVLWRHPKLRKSTRVQASSRAAQWPHTRQALIGAGLGTPTNIKTGN